MSPTSCKLKTRRHHGSTRKKFGRPEQLVDEVLKEGRREAKLIVLADFLEKPGVSRLRPGRRRSWLSAAHREDSRARTAAT
ncbi:hypothetical protein EVAR_68022_1 [Eumeta japonica]|uniref:Uncharacterized protein n=1 Tax=Eumeta variegata TaxID=151549 RepID=A0A4C1SWX4_EUMVA|nr:hypothetical protein EVAR_68022_1 [Eumeta japonica]